MVYAVEQALSKDLANVRAELNIYKAYLNALDLVTSNLLESYQHSTMHDTLSVLAETAQSEVCALYINEVDGQHRRYAQLSCHAIPRGGARFNPLPQLYYDELPFLADTLQVGMVFHKSFSELPPEEQRTLIRLRFSSMLCIPLLLQGELGGFIAFFARRDKADWQSLEIRMLSALANDLALALMRHRVESDLMTNQKRLRSLVGATEDMLFEYDEAGLIVNFWSAHPSSPNMDLRNLPLERALPGGMAKAFRDAVQEVLHANQSRTIEFKIPKMQGDVYFIARLQAVPSESGNKQNIVALVRDVTAIMQEQAQRKTMLETINLLEEAVIDLSIEGVLQHCSSAWAKLRGTSIEALNEDYGKPLKTWVHPDDAERMQLVMTRLAGGEDSTHTLKFRLLRDTDEMVWLEARLLAHHAPSGQIVGLRGVLRDITTAYLHESRITQMALYDALTQLPNRILLDDHLQQAIMRADRSGLKVALGFIDMDHFKQINDTFGHKAGDEVLVSLSRRLKSTLREIDTLARWGGDEFVVLIPDLANMTPMRTIAERLREIARQGIVLDGLETKPTISIGFAIYPDDADSAEALLSAADHTMFHAKGAGRNNVQFYAEILHSKSADREHVAMQSRLNTAVQNNELQVHYQPIINVDTMTVVAVEALARWHDEKLGWVSPEIFAPMAEKLGIIRDLGQQVLSQGLGALQQWKNAGFHTSMAVNISRSQLFAHDFVAMLMDSVSSHHLTPADITLEITESVALTDYSRQMKHLTELANQGFCLAIDDFGTGYSALSQLHEMPVQRLKIDVSFISRMHTQEGQRIVQAIVQMAQALGLGIVAEGVETQAQMQLLQNLGVNIMQGHYFSEAVPAEQLIELLQLGIEPGSERDSAQTRGLPYQD